MAKKYKQIISDLESAVKDIESKGISIGPLNSAIEELKSHSDNIEAIEDNIDAVKSEVITPIKVELEQNKKASKFSIMGFYVGIFGLLVTAISLLYTSFREPHNILIKNASDSTNSLTINKDKSDVLVNIENRLDEMGYIVNGLNEHYKPTKDEFLINQLGRVVILKSDSITFSVEAYITREDKFNNRFYPLVSLSFSTNGKNLGTKGLTEKVKIINNSGIAYYSPYSNSIIMTEKDDFVIFGKFKYEIKRIFRVNSQILTVADDKDAVLIKLVK